MFHSCVLSVDLRIPASHSLKEKRAVVRHLVEGARSRFGVAAAEVGFQDHLQRSELGFVTISGIAGQVATVLDAVDRFIWSMPDVEVVRTGRHWLDSEA